MQLEPLARAMGVQVAIASRIGNKRREGSNNRHLPPAERRATLRVEKNSPKQEIVRETLAAITKQGFYLTHEAIGGPAS
jgi:hypothetical protein